MDNMDLLRPITNGDVQTLLNLSERQARRILKKARARLNLTVDQELSIADFCVFKGINLEWAGKKLKLTTRKPGKGRV